MRSCIYEGEVRHRRRTPVPHDFTYPLFMMYLDLDELPGLFDDRWLWSARRPALAWFRREDYLGNPEIALDTAVRDEAARLTGRRPTGPIRMLTHLRYFGYVMNPVTFYYCFDERGADVEAIVAEITNTPWNERHRYGLTAADDGTTRRIRGRFAKAFHISPFMAMEQEYRWHFTPPEEALVVHMENHHANEKLFDATLTLRRRTISGTSLASVLMRYPWMTARVALGIYWQALRLKLKGNPYHEHPEKRAA